MIYLVLSQNSTDYAAAISELIWSLSRPPSARNPADVSRYYCGWIEHADGRVALVMPDADSQPIHADADGQAIAETLPIPQAEKDALAAAIEAAKGGRVNPVDMIPASLTANVLTQAEAEADGWFDEPTP